MFSRLSSWWYGKKPTLKPSLAGAESDSTVKDALSQFTDLLENEKSKINNLRNEWMLHKQDVIASGAPQPGHEHATKCSEETQEKVSNCESKFE